MNEIEDFVEDPNENSDLFDCEFTSVDAVVNQVTVFTGWENRERGAYSCRLWRGL